jgi:hypothetical protein
MVELIETKMQIHSCSVVPLCCFICCLQYFTCMDVAGVSVVFAIPSMRCDEPRYTHFLIIVVLAFVLLVVALPFIMAIMLIKQHQSVFAWMHRTNIQEVSAQQNDIGIEASDASPRASRFPSTVWVSSLIPLLSISGLHHIYGLSSYCCVVSSW